MTGTVLRLPSVNGSGPDASKPGEVGLRDVEKAAQAYLHLPDLGPLRCALAAAVSAGLEGDPLWVLLVGPPSSGKTETLRALDHRAEHVDELTAASLLTWRTGKNPGPIGLLTRVGPRALVTIGDLSTVLASSDRGLRDQLFALLRRAYDGRVVRELGTAPYPLRWEGRLTVVAAVTPAVDNYQSHANALGPRWLMLRLPESDTNAQRRAMTAARLAQAKLAEHRGSVAELVVRLLPAATDRAGRITLSRPVARRLDDFALVACIGRATVERDGYGRRDIVSLPVREEPMRLIGQLSLLVRCLLALGVEEADAVNLARRAALDSMPPARLRVLTALANGKPQTPAAIAREHGINRKVASFALEELASTGVCGWPGMHDEPADRQGRPQPWRLVGPDTALITAVVGEAP